MVYAKGRPVVDPDDPERIVEGRELTWQYLWPGDDGGSHAMLTIWRAGAGNLSALEIGFAEMLARWRAGAPLPGALYDLRQAVEDGWLLLTGVAVAGTEVPFGRVRVPVFHGHEDWAVVVSPWDGGAVAVRAALVLEVPGVRQSEGLAAELSVIEAWLARWDAVLGQMQRCVEAAGQAFAGAVQSAADDTDPGGGLMLFDAAMDETGDALALRFVSGWPDGDTHEGTVRIDVTGRVLAVEVEG
ncbi:hypothetical protein [Roseovarius sp. C03]|uniref:hypothetical protein n=1 Tax=Roseovarius sp. C03 TaxID=3449222 RepID=UPI003EDBF47B